MRATRVEWDMYHCADPKMNRGKPWSAEDDGKIMSNPQYPDQHFASQLGRSETAIQYRRAHLSVKVMRYTPEVGLDEAVRMLSSDKAMVEQILEQGKADQCAMSMFVAGMKRPAVQAPTSALQASDGSCVNGPAFGANHAKPTWFGLVDKPVAPVGMKRPAVQAPTSALPASDGSCVTPTESLNDTIRTIANGIEFEGGKMREFWSDPECVPYLIQYYPGFSAWAKYCADMT